MLDDRSCCLECSPQEGEQIIQLLLYWMFLTTMAILYITRIESQCKLLRIGVKWSLSFELESQLGRMCSELVTVHQS